MEKKIIFLPMIFFGVIFLVLIIGFLGLVIKLIKRGRDSAWSGELVEKKYFEGEDMDTDLKKDYFTLIFKTKEGKQVKVGVDKKTYDSYKVGDKAEKIKGEFHPRKLV